MPDSLWRKLTVWQRVALVVMILAAANVPVRYLVGAPRPEDHIGYSIFLLIVASVVAFRAWFRTVLWRVRNRLMFTYFLVGVVPIVLIGFLLSYGVRILLGQYASDRVREAIDDQTNAVASVARNMAVAASRDTGTPPDAPERIALLQVLQQQTPGVRAIVRFGDRVVRLPDDGEVREIPSWGADKFAGLVVMDGRPFVAAEAQARSQAQSSVSAPSPSQSQSTPPSQAKAGDTTTTTVFTFQPLTDDTLTAATHGAVLVAIAEHGANVRIDLSTNKVFLGKDGVQTPLESLHPMTLAPPRGFWDDAVVWLLPMDARDATGERGGVTLAVMSRPSLLFERLFGSLGQFGFSIIILMGVLAALLLLVEIAAVIWSVRLTRTITRTVHDLYEATRQVAAGNLSHRAPIRTRDQLSELAGSFNGMTDRLTQLIAEVREKEKLESELAIARRVQIELFPKALPKLNTLEIAGLCVPSRFVSGDYYDVVRLDDRWTTLALGDISGKGIAAALVMASVQSALHAQLKFTGSGPGSGSGSGSGSASTQIPNDDGPSTATWMARLSEQLYENTPAEKYATFFCAAYDDQRGRLVYTNAGHLPPFLVRGGTIIPLEPTGMVIGLLPVFSYDQQVIDLQPGDLLAAYTDGITEAENATAEQFEAKRLTDLLIQHADKPLDDIITIVTDHVRGWAHNPESQDDITILLARKR